MIITLADAKTYLDVTGSDDDAVITDFITAAGNAMEEFCGRHIEEVEVTEQLDSEGRRRLWLREPANAKPAVYVDGDRAFGAGAQVSASDLFWQAGRDGTSNVVEYLDNIFSAGRRTIKVVYDAGWASGSIPDGIQQACKSQVARMYSEWQRAKDGADVLQSQSVAGWAQTWLGKEGIDPAARDLLKPYINAGL